MTWCGPSGRRYRRATIRRAALLPPSTRRVGRTCPPDGPSSALGAAHDPVRRCVYLVGEVAPLSGRGGVRRRSLPPEASACPALGPARSRRSGGNNGCSQGVVRSRSAGTRRPGDRGAGTDTGVGVVPLGARGDRIRCGGCGGRVLSASQVAVARSGRAGRPFANLPRSPLRAGCACGCGARAGARPPDGVGDPSSPRMARAIRYESARGRNELRSEP